MAKVGLRRVIKTVRGKHGTHRRAYYMKAEAPKASRGHRIAGAVAGAALGAIGGAIFGGGAGAGLGAASAARGVKNDIRHGLQTYYGALVHLSNVDQLPRSVHANYAQDYMRRNSSVVASHVAKATALGGVWGAGAGAAGGAAFGAALGYAAAARLGRGGRAGGVKSGR